MNATPLKPVVSPLQLRDRIESLVLKKLLGPGSETEEILESPGTRYLVGVLAPRKRAGWRAERGANQATPRRQRLALQAPLPGLHRTDKDADGELLDGEELALGGRDTSQDGTTDQAPAQDKALTPSSFGMTFCVDREATELQISAAWGHYLKEVSEYLASENTGNPRRVWKRYARHGTHRLTLKEGSVAPTPIDPHCPEVVVQGLIRKRSDHWCVTVFLVNEQQEPERLRDSAWIFQPELRAEGVDGVAVIRVQGWCLPHTDLLWGQVWAVQVSMKEAPGDGLPVMVVDEEIYRRLRRC